MTKHHPRIALASAAVAVGLGLSACSESVDTSPAINVTIGAAEASIEPTLFCVDGHAQFPPDDTPTAALEVKPDTKVDIAVPKQVADKSWEIQIWSVSDSANGAVPMEQIGRVQPGTATTYDGFTTSDAVPDRYFIIVAIPEDPNCDAKGSAGIWTLLVSRVG